jgi:cell division septation protein DedD
MPKKDFDRDNLVKASASHRSRSSRSGARQNMPRIMIVGLLVVVAGGAALFWPRGHSGPSGIGEHQTVVSAPDSSATPTSRPHSGEVDIASAAAPSLTPEKAQDGGSAASEPQPTAGAGGSVTSNGDSGNSGSGNGGSGNGGSGSTSPEKSGEPEPVQSQPVRTQPAPIRDTTPRQQPARSVEPRAQGNYVVQVGAFGEAPNADAEAARLKARGWDTRVRAKNTKTEMIFQVQIVYFASRAEAETFIRQNSKHIPGAFAKHK